MLRLNHYKSAGTAPFPRRFSSVSTEQSTSTEAENQAPRRGGPLWKDALRGLDRYKNAFARLGLRNRDREDAILEDSVHFVVIHRKW